MPVDADNLPPILPIGTQVVVLIESEGPDGKPVHPRGAVGVIVRAPADAWHSYRVRLPDGFEASFARQELSVLAHYKAGELAQAPDRLPALAPLRLPPYPPRRPPR